ncbi:MAG: glycosyltransferase family 4 protein [Bergeyella sp.]
MKIVFNTDQIYLHGGIEKVMAEKANYFSEIPGVEVYIITTEQQGKLPCYPLNKKIKLIDLGVNYNRNKSYFSKENLKKAFIHFKEQRKLFKQLKPDVVISANFNFDHYWLPFVSGKAKVIKERHSSRFYEEKIRKNASFFKRMQFAFSDWIDSKYTHVVVLNEDEKRYVKSENAVVIPNPITIPDFSVSLENKQVLAAGRIAPVKGFDELIHIWKLITDEFPDWQLHIYGDDYLNTKSDLKKLIKELDLENVIQFKGSVPNLTETMKEYSLYAMTSETECFPMVLLESLSVGLPVVSYDCPNGPRNIISNGQDGILAEHKNREAFAEALRKLMKNNSERKEMGIRAKENANRFETEEVMKRWLNLIKAQ